MMTSTEQAKIPKSMYHPVVSLINKEIRITVRNVRLPRLRFYFRRHDRMRDIELTEAELLRCSKSFSPFDWLQIPYLNKKLYIDDRKRQEEDRKRQKEKN